MKNYVNHHVVHMKMVKKLHITSYCHGTAKAK